KKLLKIKSLMHIGRKIAQVSLEAPMKDVIEEISRKKLGMTCVVDDEQKLVGIITDGDLRRRIQKYGKTFLDKTAQDCMTPDPFTVNKEDLATTALNIMEENTITSLVIKDKEGKIEGIIHLHDLWRTEMF
ncbi:MAG: CBS domain-containing protein, partial [Candidatus Aminicenantes bacterium]|nr:CBS domain-containing protein [Candidatus Aminicenantes bacterium]